MKGLLVRVAADQTKVGGYWNSPCDSHTGRFVYVPIREEEPVLPEFRHVYNELEKPLTEFNCAVPASLNGRTMHLDPDFNHLTYGDRGQRARQIREKLTKGDILVFYAAFRDVQRHPYLIYALIGLYMIDAIVRAVTIPKEERDCNAHTRRLQPGDDIVIRAKPSVSGRLARLVDIGGFRDKAYRVRPELLKAWGGLSIKNGYLQRSVRLPEFLDARRFYDWFLAQEALLVTRNN
jgi:hypothetical protein